MTAFSLLAYRTRRAPRRRTPLHRAPSVPARLRQACAACYRLMRMGLRREAATLWQAAASTVTLAIAATAAGMLLYGDRAYVGPTYDILKEVPGGMRAYGVALALLFVMVVYGFGQQQLGAGQVLRVALALAAAWYIGWIIAIATTYVLQQQLYSWSALVANAFIAAVTNLVARHVPPDRG